MFASVFYDTLTAIAAETGFELVHDSLTPVSGGDINDAFAINARTGERYFLKLNHWRYADMFVAEQAGLAELDKADKVRVPHAIATGQSEQHAWLLLEWFGCTHGNDKSALRLGNALAEQHQVRAEQFGFTADNYIGRTPQRNAWCNNWVSFYRDYRLQPQLELAVDNGLTRSLQTGVEAIQKRLGNWFEDYMPAPSLLHGDLWGGNWAMLKNGQPVIFDPAVYYGDREADIAMTRLFGGFPASFYQAYEAAWPLDRGAQRRQPLYDLYHVLNHFNLFGGGYLAQADRIINQLLSH
jgi:fructosamine-3-kinase